MTPDQDAQLTQRLQEKLDAGYRIAIVGWKDSNHDDFTRNLPREFVFFDDAPIIVPKQVGYAVMTRFVGHDETRRVRRQVPTHKNLFTIGHLKRLLRSAAKFEPLSPATASAATQLMPTEIQDMTHAASASSAASPAGTNHQAELGEEERESVFAQAFCKAVGNNPDGELSKYEVNKVLREHFGEKANASAFKTLLEPVVKEGNTKAGAYRATKHLLELATCIDIEPTDLVEKARWLMAKKPKLEQRHKALAAEMAGINKELDRIKKAEELMEGLKRI